MSFTIALIAATVCCLVLFIYPYLIYPVLLNLLPHVEVSPAPTPEPISRPIGERFAVLFAAYNEISTARAKLDNLQQLAARYPGLEILVYDDASTDGCAEVYESRPDLVRLIRGPGRTGKAHGMKTLVSQTDRDFLVFTDANVLLDERLLDHLEPYFRDSSVGGVCGHLTYVRSEHSATEVAGGAYWTIEEGLKRRESETGDVMGGDGSIFSVRRVLYPEFLDTVQDDFTVTMSVIFSGHRLVYAPDVVAYERLVSSTRDEYKRKVRIAARAYHTHRSMRPGLRSMSRVNRWKYLSHKILRWYGAVFMVLTAILGFAAFATISALAAGAAAIVAAAGMVALVLIPALGAYREIVVAIMATFHGVLRGAAGKTYATWTPPTSR